MKIWFLSAYFIAVFSYELGTMSRESSLDIVQSFLFTHEAHNRTLSMSETFSVTGNTPFRRPGHLKKMEN